MTTDVWSRMRARVDRARQRSADTPDANGGRASSDLEDLVKIRDQLEDEIDRAIIRARDQGAPWAAIPYGRSKQSAQQRHGRAVDRQRELTRGYQRADPAASLPEATAALALADMTEDEFEAALAAARGDGDLSRANVLRRTAENRAGDDDEPTPARPSGSE